MVLHFFPNEKFTVDYISRINSLFDTKEHCFIVYNNSANICSTKDLQYENVIFTEVKKNNSAIAELISKSKRVVIHGLWFRTKTLIYLYRMLKKWNVPTIWAVWGGDFYNEYKKNKNSKNPNKIIKEIYRRKFIKRLYGINTNADYQNVIKCYKTKAKNFKGTYSYKLIPATESVPSDLINIMVGHSATDNCRHIDVFDKIKDFKDKVKIFCPLSYPNDSEYIAKVVNKGRECFEDNFVPMLNFMDYSKYVEFLNSIDIGVFYNDRQQGNGNIVNLLYLGKKIYISNENTLFDRYSRIGATLFDFDLMDKEEFLKPLSSDIKNTNNKVIADLYSDETFYNAWNEVFTE